MTGYIFSDEQGVLNLESVLTNQALENKAFSHLVADIIHRAYMSSLYQLLRESHVRSLLLSICLLLLLLITVSFHSLPLLFKGL